MCQLSTNVEVKMHWRDPSTGLRMLNFECCYFVWGEIPQNKVTHCLRHTNPYPSAHSTAAAFMASTPVLNSLKSIP